ncbi:MAG: FAD-dependent oxidoreductase, partial [Sedimentibacter sp.]
MRKNTVKIILSFLLTMSMVLSVVGCTPTEEPAPPENEETPETPDQETELTTDIVVVGAGGTGLTAAVSANENGADVIVLEKLALTGGSTALSGGSISATDTKFQRELGITDSKESWMELWKERSSIGANSIYPDYDVVDRFMDEAVVTTEWLVDYVGHEYEGIGGYGV